MGRHGVFAVDADGHVFEPEETWEKYMTGPLKERRPKYVRDNQGKPRAMLEGRLYMKPEAPGIGNIRGWDAASVRPGGADPSARL